MIGDLASAIKDRLMALQAANSPALDGMTILVDDHQELATEIDKAMNEVGLTILIGQADAKNNGQSKTQGNMVVTTQLGIGEVPTLWRTPGGGPPKPSATQVKDLVVAALQGFEVMEFQKLRVMSVVQVQGSKTRQLWELTIETQTVVQETGAAADLVWIMFGIKWRQRFVGGAVQALMDDGLWHNVNATPDGFEIDQEGQP